MRFALLLLIGLIFLGSQAHAGEFDAFVNLDTSLQYLVQNSRDFSYGDTIRVFANGNAIPVPIYTLKYEYVGAPMYHKFTITKLGNTTNEIRYFNENQNGGEKLSIFSGDTIEGQFDNEEFGSQTLFRYMKIKMSPQTISAFNAYIQAANLRGNPAQKEMEFSAKQGEAPLQYNSATKQFTLVDVNPITITVKNTTGTLLLIGTDIKLRPIPVEVIGNGLPTEGQLLSTPIASSANADISTMSSIPLSECTTVSNTCTFTIQKIGGKEIKDIDFGNDFKLMLARDSDEDGKFSIVDVRSISLAAANSYVIASQGIAVALQPLKRIGTTNQFELISDELLTVGFQGARANSEKYVVLGSTTIDDFTAAARNAIPITDFKISTGVIYRVTDVFSILNVGGKNISAENGFELTYYINLDNDPSIAPNEKQTITFQPKKSIDVQFTYANGTPIKKSEEEVNEYLIENDGKIQIKITGLKEDKTGNMATARLVNEYNPSSGSLENYIDLRSIVSAPTVDPQGYNLGENTLPLLIEREYCKRSTTQSITYECTLLIKTIEEKPITKQSEFGIVIYYDSDGDEKYESEETTTYTFKPATPTCTTLLECLAQLDKTIASKYLD